MTANNSLGFQNISSEIVEDVETQLIGSIPSWVQGALFRCGPGIFTIPIKESDLSHNIFHWFDGYSVMHRFKIENGKVQYRNKKMAEALENYVAAIGGTSFTFGPDPCKKLFKGFQSKFHPLDPKGKEIQTGKSPSNIGVTISQLQGNRMFNHSDISALQEFDPDTLSYMDTTNFSQLGSKEISGRFSAAHGQYDRERREYVNFVTDFTSDYIFFSVPDVGIPREVSSKNSSMTSSRIIARIPTEKKGYLHSFGMTKNYVILEAWPLYINGQKMIQTGNLVEAMDWVGSDPTKFYVIDRNTNEWIGTYHSQSFFCFHNINAWEENGDLFLDLTSYPNDEMLKSLNIPEMTREGFKYSQDHVSRIQLEKVASSTRENSQPAKIQELRNGHLELPRINPKYQFRKYRYAYGLSNVVLEGSKIVKMDLSQNIEKTWSSEGCIPGEALFIPDPHGNEEDDGVLLSIVLDFKEKRSFLLVLKAQDLSELARAIAPLIVPFGFHGNFFGKDTSSFY